MLIICFRLTGIIPNLIELKKNENFPGEQKRIAKAPRA